MSAELFNMVREETAKQQQAGNQGDSLRGAVISAMATRTGAATIADFDVKQAKVAEIIKAFDTVAQHGDTAEIHASTASTFGQTPQWGDYNTAQHAAMDISKPYGFGDTLRPAVGTWQPTSEERAAREVAAQAEQEAAATNPFAKMDISKPFGMPGY